MLERTSLRMMYIEFAAQHGNLPVIRFLVGHGIRLNVRDNDILESAVLSGHLELVKYLVKQGFKIKHKAMELVPMAMIKTRRPNFAKYVIDNSDDVQSAKDEAISLPLPNQL